MEARARRLQGHEVRIDPQELREKVTFERCSGALCYMKCLSVGEIGLVDIHFEVPDEKFSGVTALFNSADFEDIQAVFVEAYGPAHTSEPVPSPYEGTKNVLLRSNGRRVSIELLRFDDSAEGHGAFSIAMSDRRQQRDDHDRQKKAERIKSAAESIR